MFRTAATRTAAALSVAAAARAAALLWVVAAVAAAGCGFALPASSVAAGEAIDWHAEPQQDETQRVPFVLPTRHGEVRVLPRAAFDVSAVIPAPRPYSIDGGAFPSPRGPVLTSGPPP